jgi:hypothetical protein
VAKAWWRIERWRRGEAEGMVEDREAAKWTGGSWGWEDKGGDKEKGKRKRHCHLGLTCKKESRGSRVGPLLELDKKTSLCIKVRAPIQNVGALK